MSGSFAGANIDPEYRDTLAAADRGATREFPMRLFASADTR